MSPEEADILKWMQEKRDLGWTEMQCLEFQIEMINLFNYEISRWHHHRDKEDREQNERGY